MVKENVESLNFNTAGFSMSSRSVPVEWFSQTNVLKQLRANAKIGMSELSNAIISFGGVHSPVMFVELPPIQAKEYIKLINKAYKGRESLLRCIKNENGNYMFQIYGHRRVVNVIDIEEKNIHLRDTPVTVLKPERDNSDLRFLILTQINENTHRRDDIKEASVSVAALYRVYGGKGKISFKDLSKKLGGKYTDVTISRAVKYDQLPKFIKTEVDNHRLSYSSAIELFRLINDDNVPESYVEEILKQAVKWKYSAAKIKKASISLIKYIEEFDAGQNNLFAEGISLNDVVSRFQKDDRERMVLYYHHIVETMSWYIRKSKELDDDSQLVFEYPEVATVLLAAWRHFKDLAQISGVNFQELAPGEVSGFMKKLAA